MSSDGSESDDLSQMHQDLARILADEPNAAARAALEDLVARSTEADANSNSSVHLSLWPMVDQYSPSDGGMRPRHLVWTPATAGKRTTAIVSSRLGRALDCKDAFFRVLRIACSQLDPQRQALVSTEGTATHRYVRRAAELFGLDLYTIQLPRKETLAEWIDERRVALQKRLAGRAWDTQPVIRVSPSLTGCEEPATHWRDAALLGCADQVLAIHIRKRGKIQAALQDRLTQAVGRTFVALGDPDLVAMSIAEPCMDQGAIGWYLGREDEATVISLGEPPNAKKGRVMELAEWDATKPVTYLSHCTRQTNGPWPDQSEDEYLDELIMGDRVRDRSAFAALCRILAQQRVFATGAAIRQAHSVVSLTEVPLREMHRLRRYRAHRGRWDFEPYGIAVRQECLQQRGARQVHYGSEADWATLPDEDRPYFQKLGEQDNAIDWRVEREWRLQGDLQLEEILEDQAVVFVPTRSEAVQVSRLCRWPVVVMSSHS